MKTITFNEKNYNIPQKWSEVTIQMLADATTNVNLIPDAPLIGIVSAYTGIPLQQLKVGKANVVTDIIKDLSFIENDYIPTPSNSFIFNGETYSTKDDLINHEFQDWISIQTALYNYKNNPEIALPRIIAILCKKDGESLDDFDLNERAELFKSIPMTDAKNVEGFFLHSINAYNAIILLSSTTKEQEKLVQHKLKELQNIMKKSRERTGWYSPTNWLIGIYQIYLRYIKTQLEKSFNSIHLNQ